MSSSDCVTDVSEKGLKLTGFARKSEHTICVSNGILFLPPPL